MRRTIRHLRVWSRKSPNSIMAEGQSSNNKTLKKYYMDLSWMQIRELRSYHDILTLESIMSSHQPWSFASQLQSEFARITRTAEQGQIRMTQETSPNYGPRRDAFFSRACRLYNTLPAYNLPPMESNFIMRIRGDPDAYRSGLRSRLYWKMNERS